MAENKKITELAELSEDNLADADVFAVVDTSAGTTNKILWSTMVSALSDVTVTGPASSTDNAVARFDSTTGKVIQNSTVIISDAGDVTATSLNGVLGSGTPAAATVTTLTTSGIASIDDTTDTTSGVTGSIHTDGGLGVAKSLHVGTTAKIIGVTTHSGNVVSDTDSTDDLGTTGVRWANTWTDTINGVTSPTAQYTSAEETKLAGIETAADVTDATNVAAALANGVAALTSGEVTQLANIGTETISAAEWGYVAASTQAYDAADHSKLNGIEALADVTDATNVAAALANGVAALTSGEVTQLANIGTETISATEWGYVAASTGDVTLAGTPDYITISNQVITRHQIDLTADVSGNLPVGNLNSGTGASGTSFWRGDGTWSTPSGAGDVIGPASSTDNAVARFDSTTGKLLQNSTVVITDAGNVGIGTSSPSQPLQVVTSGATAAGIAATNTTGNANLFLSTANTGSATIFFGDTDSFQSGLIQYSHTSNSLISRSAGVMTFQTGGANERMRIDSSGRLITGNNASISVLSVEAGFQNYAGSGYMTAGKFAADAFAPFYSFVKSRNATVGAHTIVQNGDDLGTIAFTGSDGTNFIRGAQIRAQVDGTPGTNDMPGRLTFFTTGDGASSPSERMRITSAGNVGIGTSNPLKKLDVSFNSAEIALNSTSSSYSRVNHYHNGTAIWTTGTRTTSDYHIYRESGGGNVIIDNSNVGIGTASPSYLLDLYKSASTVARVRNTAATGGTPSTTHGEFVIESTDANMGMQFLGSTTADQRILFSDTSANSGQIAYNHTTNYMALFTNGGERMRITSAGNVGIGRTAPTYNLEVDGVAALYAASTETRNFEVGYGRTGNGYSYVDLIGDATYTDFGLRLIRGNTGANTSSELVHRGTGPLVVGATDAGYLSLKTNNAERMRITSAGNVGIGTSAPSYKLHVSGDIYATGNITAYSAAAAKDEITTIPNALDLVEKLRGVSFRWKNSGERNIGLIYEEVKEVVPELTSDKEGHVGVAYQNTVALLIEAVKTLSAKVRELESK